MNACTRISKDKNADPDCKAHNALALGISGFITSNAKIVMKKQIAHKSTFQQCESIDKLSAVDATMESYALNGKKKRKFNDSEETVHNLQT